MSYRASLQRQAISQNGYIPPPMGVQLSRVDRDRIMETSRHEKAEKTKKYYRSRLKEIIKFVEEKYLIYARDFIKSITEEDLCDSNFNWHGAIKDFVCENFHPEIMKVFLSMKKVKIFNSFTCMFASLLF